MPEHLIAQTPFSGGTREPLQVLAEDGGVGPRVMQSRTEYPARRRDIRQHRVRRGQSDARRHGFCGPRSPATRVSSFAPGDAGARASRDDRAAAPWRCAIGWVVCPTRHSDHVLLVQRSRAEPAHVMLNVRLCRHFCTWLERCAGSVGRRRAREVTAGHTPPCRGQVAVTRAFCMATMPAAEASMW